MWQTKTRAMKKAELVLGQSAKRNQRGVSHDVPPLQMKRMGKTACIITSAVCRYNEGSRITISSGRGSVAGVLRLPALRFPTVIIT